MKKITLEKLVNHFIGDRILNRMLISPEILDIDFEGKEFVTGDHQLYYDLQEIVSMTENILCIKKLKYVNSERGFWEFYEYDEHGNFILHQYIHGDIMECEYKYNNNGKLVYEKRIGSSGEITEVEYLWSQVSASDITEIECIVDHEILSIKRSDGYWEKNVYDKNYRKISNKKSDGYWEEYKYDSNGNRISVRDSNGNWEESVYGKRNDSNLLEDGYNDYIKSCKTSDGIEYIFIYLDDDGKDYVYSAIDNKKMSTVIIIYDKDDNIIYHKDSKGNIERMTYDEKGNELTKTIIDENNHVYIENTYDDKGNLILVKPTYISGDGIGEETFKYHPIYGFMILDVEPYSHI